LLLFCKARANAQRSGKACTSDRQPVNTCLCERTLRLRSHRHDRVRVRVRVSVCGLSVTRTSVIRSPHEWSVRGRLYLLNQGADLEWRLDSSEMTGASL